MKTKCHTVDGQPPVAQFAPGHTARESREGLDVFAPDGAHRATFPGAGAHRAVTDDNGQLYVLAKAPLTRDEDRLLRLQDELRRLNETNAEFWRRRGGMPGQ
jgi:hypothetical protein